MRRVSFAQLAAREDGSKMQMTSSRLVFCLMLCMVCTVPAQSTSATFGEIVRLGGVPSDAVMDEARGRIYLIN